MVIIQGTDSATVSFKQQRAPPSVSYNPLAYPRGTLFSRRDQLLGEQAPDDALPVVLDETDLTPFARCILFYKGQSSFSPKFQWTPFTEVYSSRA